MKADNEEVEKEQVKADEQLTEGRKEQIETAERSKRDGIDDEDLEDLNSMKGNTENNK